MSKRIKKSESTKFVKELSTYIKSIGGVIRVENDYPLIFDLNTIAGNLVITLYDDNLHTFTMFTKFDNPDRAKKIVSCNSFSGKFNLHLGVIDVDIAIEAAKKHLELTKS